MRLPLMLWILVGLLSSCSKDFIGDPKENQAPETFLLADTIARSGENRFESVLQIQWSGTDPDGYIEGFEISLDGNTWSFTRAQDTLLTVNLPGNSDTFDVNFSVRAVDNQGLRDASPARLIFPVKNSRPEVHFVIPAGSPTRSFPAVKYFWVGSDPDGNASLDHYELIWNDTALSPLILSNSFSEATFVAKTLSGTTSPCTVFPGTLNTALPDEIQGMILDDLNVLYIRAVDQVGAKSPWTASPNMFIRKPQSDILFINAQRSSFNRTAFQNLYSTQVFNAVGKAFDTL
ncbi:MAG: hypothetical protein LPK45_03495 [Bacteroidota bacterium]|nr:hypothetical protein [Bacteroidota bacterium]MDX5430115.1 hypothetical protein [Bacteroidota bacterium]MDX5468876.1 hypothetical protein [Bacteroidota bacterium]